MLFESTGESLGTKRAMTHAGLPELTGQPADLTRANAIRNRILMEADDELTRLRSDEVITDAQRDTDITSPRQVSENQVHAAEIALNKVRDQRDASWWIAHEDTAAEQLLTRLMLNPSDQP